MNFFISSIVLLILTTERGNAVIEVDETLFQRIVADILNSLYSIPVFEQVTCDSINNSLVNYYLYTPQNRDEPVTLRVGETNNLTLFNPTLETKLLTHGWTGNISGWLEQARDVYLRTGDYNIILLDWSVYAMNLYSQSACFAKKIAENTASLLVQIRDEANLDYNRTHLIGHSLGGQLVGLTGQSLQNLTGGGKLQRITGLDAAGPLFCHPRLEDADERISSDDAYFVDAIHTSDGDFGCGHPYGEVNFYPNCGRTQAGCETTNFTLLNITGSLGSILDNVGCSHQRAPMYWIESITSNGFVSVQCNSCAAYVLETCENDGRDIMGEDASTSIEGNFFLTTRTSWPFVMNDE